VIYLDNAATTWPKPDETISAMVDCIKNAGANPGRGGHQMSLAAGRIILETREELAGLFGVSDPLRIVLTGNATEAINLALKGFLKEGDHVITGSMEHNAVARPLNVLRLRRGVDVTEIRCAADGQVDPAEVRKAFRKNTSAVVMIHASNVTGTVMPVEEIGLMARENGAAFIVDTAQTAGLLDIDVNRLHIDMLAFAGHKSLYGPQGTGGLFIREGINLEPLKEGGTGSKSESLDQPDEIPDKFESGTPNTPGIAGLGAGIRYVKSRGLAEIWKHEQGLVTRFLDGLSQMRKIQIYGPDDPSKRVPVVSINVNGQDSSEIAFVLDRVFGIACRSGLHCAPSAHKTIGTLDRGTVRFSFSIFNTCDEVDRTLEALSQTIAELSR